MPILPPLFRLRALLSTTVAGLLAAIALAVVPATAAHADCPINDPDCGGPVEHTYSSTLTVNTQNVGSVASSPAGIACPGTCSVTDEVTVPSAFRPTTGWTTYTLTASGGPAGTTPTWTGCDSVDASHRCIVTNDAAAKTVSLGWFDITDPYIDLTSPDDGVTVGRTIFASASAADGAGIKEVRFEVDNVVKFVDTTAPYSASLDLSALPSGSTHFITAQAFDNNDNTSLMTHAVTVVTSTHVSIGDLPAVVSTRDPLSVAITGDLGTTKVCSTVDATTQDPIPGTMPVICDSNYAIPFTSQTPDGDYRVVARASDGYGNTAEASKDVTVDNTAPSLDVTGAPADGSTFQGSTMTVTVSSTDPHGVTLECWLDETSVPCTPGGTVSVAVTPGDHNFAVHTTDDVGNDQAFKVNFTAAAPPTTSVTKHGTRLSAHAAHKTISRHHRMRLIATVKPRRATGKVVFTRHGHVLCRARIHDGRATCRTKRLHHGKVRVVAHYLGSAHFKGSRARFSFRVR